MSCSCPDCTAACKKIPGVFTPAEAIKAIRAGQGDKMMLVPYLGDGVFHLMPRSYNRYNTNRPGDSWDACGPCVFLADGLCSIHHTDYKPKECREFYSSKCLTHPNRDGIEGLELRGKNGPWNTFVGRAVVAIWERAFP